MTKKQIEMLNNEIPVDCGDFSEFSNKKPQYDCYAYFGNCATVYKSVFGDGTIMCRFINDCTIIKTKYVVDKLVEGDKPLPKLLVKNIEKLKASNELNNRDKIVVGIDEYQAIMFVYLTKTDKHYFFDCIK